MLINYQSGKPVVQKKLAITADMQQSIQQAEQERRLADVQSNLLLVSQFGADPNAAVTDYLKDALKGELKGVNASEKSSLKLVLKAKPKHRAAIVKAAFIEHL
ncbi:MAG: hypothetical protein E6Q83_03615 [Thiothrix sp.]|nr:MAG: hypothetical protein E6Q83_03615 [Thiothrix sp.]